MRGCLVFGVRHVLSCLLCLIHVLIFFFFFFLRQTTLCMVCLKSYSVFILGGGLGFLGWGGFFFFFFFFVALKKKIWVCCHVQVYVQLYDALFSFQCLHDYIFIFDSYLGSPLLGVL